MKSSLPLVPLLMLVATPAHATGGITCRTAGANPVEVALVTGHVAGSPVVSANMQAAGRQVPVSAAQWWLDSSELRLLLVDPDALRQELLVRARRNGDSYDGSLWRDGRRRWVRCRES